LLQRLKPHPHVVRFLGAEVRATEAVELFELCTGGTLLARLSAGSHGCPCLSEAETLEVLGGLASALAFLHRTGIVHYDVKSENVLKGADALWKLGDFGSASERTLDLSNAPRRAVLEAEEFVHGRCTPIYRAPELADVYLRWPIGPKADIFALGCVHFCALAGRHPFPIDSALANVQARFQLPAEASASYAPAVLSWARRMLAREPDHRPRASDLEAEVRSFCEEPEWVADFSLAPPVSTAELPARRGSGQGSAKAEAAGSGGGSIKASPGSARTEARSNGVTEKTVPSSPSSFSSAPAGSTKVLPESVRTEARGNAVAEKQVPSSPGSFSSPPAGSASSADSAPSRAAVRPPHLPAAEEPEVAQEAHLPPHKGGAEASVLDMEVAQESQPPPRRPDSEASTADMEMPQEAQLNRPTASDPRRKSGRTRRRAKLPCFCGSLTVCD